MNAYLFDVDGVLSDLGPEPLVIKPEVLDILIAILQKNQPIGLISGRTSAQQLLYVVTPLEERIRNYTSLNKEIIDNVFVSGEFGVTSIVHENTERKLKIDKSLALNLLLMDELREASKEFSELTFDVKEKEHVFSIVSNHDVTREEFRKLQIKIVERFKTIVGDNPNIEIHVDRVAVNVKHKRANKGSATQHYLSWLDEKKIHAEKFYVFGDSYSDLQMGEELYKRSLPFEFIFVGDHKDIHDQKVDFPVILTEKQNDEGTMSYFKVHTIYEGIPF